MKNMVYFESLETCNILIIAFTSITKLVKKAAEGKVRDFIDSAYSFIFRNGTCSDVKYDFIQDCINHLGNGILITSLQFKELSERFCLDDYYVDNGVKNQWFVCAMKGGETHEIF